jgi:hypothetical protein
VTVTVQIPWPIGTFTVGEKGNGPGPPVAVATPTWFPLGSHKVNVNPALTGSPDDARRIPAPVTENPKADGL